jgi:Mycobacterium membrane protein
MTDSPRRDAPDATQPLPYGYPGYTDPAYSNQAPQGTYYQPPPSANPTQQLPPYGYDPRADPRAGIQFGPPYPPGGMPPEPPDPNGRGPRPWLWAIAAVVGVVVLGLMIALVIVNSSQQQTVVAPPPAPMEPNFTTQTTSRAPTTTRPTTPAPSATNTPPDESTTPGETETVVYEVTGTGRAINITYVDAGGVLQTEFNVILPWSKEVQLTKPADRSASVSIINVGREISCSITLGGREIQERTGSGLTICSAMG